MLTVYYHCRLVISSYHKSCQQCFDILLNYKKLGKFISKEKKIQISK